MMRCAKEQEEDAVVRVGSEGILQCLKCKDVAIGYIGIVVGQ